MRVVCVAHSLPGPQLRVRVEDLGECLPHARQQERAALLHLELHVGAPQATAVLLRRQGVERPRDPAVVLCALLLLLLRLLRPLLGHEPRREELLHRDVEHVTSLGNVELVVVVAKAVSRVRGLPPARVRSRVLRLPLGLVFVALLVPLLVLVLLPWSLAVGCRSRPPSDATSSRSAVPRNGGQRGRLRVHDVAARGLAPYTMQHSSTRFEFSSSSGDVKIRLVLLAEPA